MTLVIVATFGLVLGAGCDSSDPSNGDRDGRADIDRRDGIGRRDGVGNADSTVDGPLGDTTVDAGDAQPDVPGDSTHDGIQDGGDASVDGAQADSTRDGGDATVDGSSADSTSDGTQDGGDASVDTVPSTDTTVDTTSADSTVDSTSGDGTVDSSNDAPTDAPPPPDSSVDSSSDITVSSAGCSDGTREAFTDLTSYPNIAGCAGGWSVPGVLTPKSPACSRVSGNSSSNPSGSGCAAEDLCAAGWHICATAAEVASKSSTGCTGAVGGGRTLFFTTRQSGNGNGNCGATGANDIFGCGTLGAAPANTCSPLDRFSNNLCSSLGAPWSCGTNGVQEANNVVKTAVGGGGVLCCR